MTTAADVRSVHLLALPVPLAAASREHFEGLMREFALIAAAEEDNDHVPARLMELVTTLTRQFAGANTAADQRLEDAIDSGQEVIDDHVLELPAAAAPASQALADIIDEADDYCRRGEHLLTLAFPPVLDAYRRWYLGQVVDQLGGAAPVPWPDSPGARELSA